MTDCADLTDALGASRPVSAALRDHARECPGCGALLLLDEHLRHAAEHTRAMEPSPMLQAVMAAPVPPTTHFSACRRAWLPVGVSLGVALVVLRVRPRMDLVGQQSSMGFWSSAGVLWALAGAGVFVVLLRGRSGVGLPAAVRWAFVLCATVVFEALAVWTTHPVIGSVVGRTADGVFSHPGCALEGTVVAATVLAVLLGVSRRTAPSAPVSAGVAAGVAAGLSGVLTLQCVCPVAVPLHVAVVHGTVLVVGAVLGAMVGRRVLTP